MGKRGPNPQRKIKIRWSPDFAYGIGLLATDGCLSRNGRYVTFVSKDRQQVLNFQKAFKIKVRIGRNWNGARNSRSYRCQFGDIEFGKFLMGIGMTPSKSKIIKKIRLPKKYFWHFLRGNFDGDGSFYSYWDRRWKSSFMYYLHFSSASGKYLRWLRKEIKKAAGVSGHITKSEKSSCYQLKYAKRETDKVTKKMYSKGTKLYLRRKHLKVMKTIGRID